MVGRQKEFFWHYGGYSKSLIARTGGDILLKTGKRWSSTPGECNSGSLLKNDPMEEVGD